MSPEPQKCSLFQPLGKLPKDFQKLASSPTREGIAKHIARFYCGGNPEMRETETPGTYSLHHEETGRRLTSVVIETARGFYFGYLEPK